MHQRTWSWPRVFLFVGALAFCVWAWRAAFDGLANLLPG